ncbi:hypothetical protein BV25DRAFT_529532 [Artomyces pyxidatus]|uniref:Uncharacterized protein n=1 Tax=Artomyces pyxidatus TaxID=48021 RepID=A0ACB8TID6_9AGAM|nr:hypothetical protein BV25DRAFT_529532 [Artomyces pyxidatus]
MAPQASIPSSRLLLFPATVLAVIFSISTNYSLLILLCRILEFDLLQRPFKLIPRQRPSSPRHMSRLPAICLLLTLLDQRH